MGAWGTGILQNDTTADVWAEFKQLYHLGNSVSEICKKLEDEYMPIHEQEEYADFWTGIAHGEWMCGELKDSTISKLKECVNEGKGLELWKENEKDFVKRKKAISEFIEKIKTPKDKPLKRKKIVPCPAYFNKGDILSVQLEDGQFMFGLAFSLEKDEIDGGNNIIFSSLISDKEISKEDFLESKICYLDIGGQNNYYQGYFWGIFGARNMKRKIKKSKVIGNIQFDDYLGVSNSIPFGDWNNIEELINEQRSFEEKNSSINPHAILVKEFIEGRNSDLELKLAEHANQLWRKKLKEMNAT